MRHKARAWPESVNRSGQIVLGHSQLALLHGLYDRPNGHAVSIADWVRAATPYADLFRVIGSVDALRHAALRVPAAWVTQEPTRHRITATLLPRGRAIIERELPAYVRRHGEYRGLRVLRERDEILKPRLSLQYTQVLAGPFGAKIRAIGAAWRRRNPSRGLNAQLKVAGAVDALTSYVCGYTIKHAALPSGLHWIPCPAYHRTDLLVDFDDLIAG